MPKIKKEEAVQDEFSAHYCRILSKPELQALMIDVKKHGGWNKYLAWKQVVRLDDKGEIVAACEWAGISSKNIEAIAGTGITYNHDFLYPFWQKVEKQLKDYQFGLEQAKKREEKQNGNIQQPRSEESPDLPGGDRTEELNRDGVLETGGSPVPDQGEQPL